MSNNKYTFTFPTDNSCKDLNRSFKDMVDLLSKCKSYLFIGDSNGLTTIISDTGETLLSKGTTEDINKIELK